MEKIQTMIFDLDGTLLDTLADLATSVNHALVVHGLPPRPTAQIRQFLGNGIRSLVERSVPAGTGEGDFERVFQTFREHYVAHCLDATQPYAGITDVLRRLHRHGISLGIVSNKLQPAVSELADRFFKGLVDVAVGESPTVRRKPNPDAVLAALAQLGGSKDRAVYVGDSEVDIETARNAGLPCISVLWGFRDEDFLRQRYPDATYIHRPDELLPLVGIGE